jgi:hypothetical protein
MRFFSGVRRGTGKLQAAALDARAPHAISVNNRGAEDSNLERQTTTMMRNADFDAELDALCAAGRVIPRLPDVVRIRSLRRARAAMAEAASWSIEPVASGRRCGVALALAASLAMVIAGASAGAAWSLRSPRSTEMTSPVARPIPSSPSPVVEPDSIPEPAATVPVQLNPTSRPRQGLRHAPARESYAAEVALLQRAQIAYAGRDYVNALALAAEHGRRFPNGRLAEEREALRVRALTGAGRTEDAERVAATFAERFSRSVLLPRPSAE